MGLGLGRLELLERFELRLGLGIRNLLLGFDKRIKDPERGVLQIVLLGSTLNRQGRLDVATRDGRLVLVLEKVIRLEKTLVKRNVVRKVDSRSALHLLYLPIPTRFFRTFAKRLVGAFSRTEVAVDILVAKVAASDSRTTRPRNGREQNLRESFDGIRLFNRWPLTSVQRKLSYRSV